MKDILQKLAAIENSAPTQLTESAVPEASNFDSKKVSTGTVYSRKYDADTGETTGTKRTDNDAKRGRGRPKKDADNDGEVMKPDWSAFGIGKVNLPKDKNARKIKGRDTVDTVNETAVMKRALEVIESAVMLEKEMTDAQMAKREEIVKGMKGDMEGFKKRYGNRAEAVMYATATKQAMKEGADSYMPSGEDIMGKRPEDETMGDKMKKFVKKVANKVAPDDETLLKDLQNKADGLDEASWINGKKQDDSELVWKQTSMSYDQAVEKYGKEHVKLGGKNQRGDDTVEVHVPLVAEAKVKEDDVEEGNAFTGAKAKAEAEGKDEFEVDGKKYKVNESAELAECGEPMMPAGEVTISGTPDALATMLKMAGMQSMAMQTPAVPPMEEGFNKDGSYETSDDEATEFEDEQEVDEWANSPAGVEGDEEYQGIEAAIPSGDDLHREKGAYPAAAGGDNPMAIDEEMWAAYQALKAELQ